MRAFEKSTKRARNFSENVLKSCIGLLEIPYGKWYNTVAKKKEGE